jgi:hypothetical protein
MVLLWRALPVSVGVGSARASARMRVRSARQARTTPQHIDATPLQPPRVARSPRQSATIAPSRSGPPSPSRLLKSIRGYDDVNRSSYTRSVSNNDAARHHNYR